MTGTPSILRDFKFPRQQHLIDRMQNCVHVVPKEIIFVDREQSRNIAQKMLNDGKCAVFFFNRTRELISFYNTIKKKYPLLIARVAVSFSDEEKRKAYSKSNKEDFARMEETEKYLAAHQKLPDRIQLFLTTERNKEGINIKNPDVRTMFVESHAECSVVQMAGRLREGIDKLYVVTDAIPHNDTESKFEWTTTNDGEIIEYYNQELQALLRKYELDPTELFGCAPQQDERISSYISFVEEKNPYILFDPFAMEFRLYKERYKSKQYYEQQNKIFEEAKSDPQKLCSLVRSWYPYAEISVIYSLKTQITQYLEQNDLLNREIDYSEQQRLLSYINDLTGENREKLGPALKAFGYAFAPKNKHKWCVGTIQLNDQV